MIPARLQPFLATPVRDHEGIEAQRSALAAQIERLPKNSPKRPILQAKLQMLTEYGLARDIENMRADQAKTWPRG